MKLSSLALLSCSCAVVEAFTSSPGGNRLARNVIASTRLGAAPPPMSFDEDLALTIQVILDHQKRSVTVSKEQFIQKIEAAVKPAKKAPVAPVQVAPVETATVPSVKVASDVVDVSVPYDAAARLAYESIDNTSTLLFDEFRSQYLADAVAMVKSKQPKKEQEGGDVSPPPAVSTTVAAEATVSKPETTADESTTKQRSLLRAVVSWAGKKVAKVF